MVRCIAASSRRSMLSGNCNIHNSKLDAFAAAPAVEAQRAGGVHRAAERRQHGAAERLARGTERDRVEDRAVATHQAHADMAVADLARVDDAVIRKGEGRLGLAGAEGPGALDCGEKPWVRAAGGQRRVDEERIAEPGLRDGVRKPGGDAVPAAAW